MAQRAIMTPLGGGLDLVTPPFALRPGFASAAENYEASTEGYTRVAGYERFDGRPTPSAAAYTSLPYIFGGVVPQVGDVVTGGATGTTGTVLSIEAPTSGSHDATDAAGILALANVSGLYQLAEALTVDGQQIAIANGVGTTGGSLNEESDARLTLAAAEIRRADIQPPPGSGPIRGVVTFRGDVLCWRDSEDGTTGQMFLATPDGWALRSFGHAIGFTDALSAFLPGTVVTGATSGASGTIRRVMLDSGAWDGTGAGRLVIDGLAGVFQDGEAIDAEDGSALTEGGAVPVRLAPGGSYRAVERNFYASEETTRLYVAYGTGPAFEWDGSVLVPILTGTPLADDQPEHVAVHLGHLALGYRSGSVQLSEPGEPLSFRGIAGAAEVGFGSRITGLLSDAKGALFIAGASRMGYLTGASAADFDLRIITDDSGALPGTLLSAGEPMYVDDRGIRRMSATEAFGDWRMNAVSEPVEPMMRARRDAGLRPVCMFRVKQKDQVRLVWPDGSGLTVFLGAQRPQIMPFRLGFRLTCATSGEDAQGREVLLAGGEDGSVYQLDSGPSFDGQRVDAFIRLAWDNQRSPGRVKRYLRARFDGVSLGRASTIGVGAEFGFAASTAAARTDGRLLGRGGMWDDVEYVPVVWSAPAQDHFFGDLDGMGENIGLLVVSRSVDEGPHTLTAATTFYSEKRMVR